MAESALARRLRDDLNAARKSQDRARVLLLGTVLSDLHNREIELGRPLSDEEVVEVLRRAIRRRRESAEAMRSRPERAREEAWEADVLETYCPPALSDEEIRRMAREAIDAGAGSVGAVMKALLPRVRGRADGRRVNEIVQEELRARGGS
jgi:uncharacterized protein YqeY